MINWFIIILIIAGILVLMKISHIKHSRHKLGLMIFIVLLLFFIASIYFVAATNHVDMTTVSGFGTGMKIYGGWLVNSFDNIRTLTGAAIGLDWKATNKTVPQNISNNINLIDSGKKVGGAVVNATIGTLNKINPKANVPSKHITSYN